MRNSKLCISACCVGIVWGLSMTALAAPPPPSDQDKALEALRNAEAVPVSADPAVTNATAVAPSVPATEPTPAPVAETPHIEAPPPAITAAPAPAPAPAPVAAAPDDQSKALEALRHAESSPVRVDTTITSAPTEAVPPTVAISSTPMSIKEREAQVAELQRQRKMAEDKAASDRMALEDAARKQREQDDLRVQQAMEAQKTATDLARANRLAQEDAARRASEQDQTRIREAMDAERLAAEQLRAAKLAEEAAIAAEHKRAQEEAARRAEQARLAKTTVDPVPFISTPVTDKEKRLAELLRQYQADEITPYEYHMRRAKIISAP